MPSVTMPILPQEPDVFPEGLLDEAATTIDQQWWLLYTLTRREKELMRRLRSQKIAHYGPLIKKRTRSPSGRTRQSFVPLFPGYVFLCGTGADRQQALQTNCVSRTIDIPDIESLQFDLQQIQRLIASDAPLTPEARLESGARVRVRRGPLEGLEGVVVSRRGMQRLLVSVEFLQQGASIEIDDFLLEEI